MKSTYDTDRIATAELQGGPVRAVLTGQFAELLRSPKGKIKGLVLRTVEQDYAVKLPRYLRPMLVRELEPGMFVQVWAYQDDQQWRGINVLPLAESEAIALQSAWDEQTTARLATDLADPADTEASSATAVITPTPSAESPKQVCVQVCRKGKCFKQGGRQILEALEAEVAQNPDLQHVSVKGVGCLKACKKGPNLKLSNSKKVISGVTPDNAAALIAKHVNH